MEAEDPFAELRRLAPRRDLPEPERERLGVVREGRGRPRRVEPQPEKDEYLERLAELRAQVALLDPVLAAASDSTRAREVLDRTIREMAVECASLAFDRVQAERRGVDVAALCSRRVSALTQIAALVVQRGRTEPPSLDVRGDKFQKLVSYFHQTLAECAREALPPDVAERFLRRYAEMITNWEDKVDRPTGASADAK